MTSHIKTNQPSYESLQLVTEAYKATLAAQVARTKQAEDVVITLMLEKISEEDFLNKVVAKITEHIDANGLDRATQYAGIIQTTLIALNALQKTDPNPSVVEIIKALTLSLECSK